MMAAASDFFWIFVVLIFYVYFGYPLLLLALSKLRPVPPIQKADINPTVSLIIPAYNEEDTIVLKMENCLKLDYPKNKLQIIVGSDGSSDETNTIVNRYKDKGVILVASENNQGKSAIENTSVGSADGEIIFFSDANVMLRPNAVKEIVNNFRDGRVGCVIGKATYLNEADTSVSRGEGLYWQYELFLRKKESEIGNFAMGSGPIMAIRRDLFQPLDPDVGEDFVLPMLTAINGYRVVYEPEAISEEILFQDNPKSMLRTKVRIISKDLRGLFLYRTILNPFRYPLYSWGLISHKLLRWLVPYLLIAVFASNLLLLGRTLYSLTLILQIAFYSLASAGYLWQRKDKPPRILGIPFFFCLVNLAAMAGVVQFILGKQSGRWKPIR